MVDTAATATRASLNSAMSPGLLSRSPTSHSTDVIEVDCSLSPPLLTTRIDSYAVSTHTSLGSSPPNVAIPQRARRASGPPRMLNDLDAVMMESRRLGR